MVRANQRQLLTIFLIVFIDLLGFGLILPLLPYIAEKYSASPVTIGLLTATYSLFQFLAGPILGRLSDRFGRRKILILSQLGSVAGYLLLGIAHSLPLLFLARLIDGVTGGNISIAQAVMADLTDKKTRAKGMGLLGAAFGLGFMLGPAMGGFLSRYGFATPAFFAAGVGLITTITTALFLQETVNLRVAKKDPRTKFSWANLRTILTTRPISDLVIAFFLLSLAFSGMQGVYALFVQVKFGWGPTEVGYLFALVGIVAIIAQLKILPTLLSRYGQRTTLKISVPLLAAGFGIVSLAPNVTIMLLANTLIPLGNALANPTITAIATESIPPDEYGETLGILQSAGSLGRIFGPIIAGELFARFNHTAPFQVSTLIFIFVAIWILPRITRKSTY